MAILASHWIACILGMGSRIQGDACAADFRHDNCVVTWLTQGSSYDELTGKVSVESAYAVALHASMSLLVHPHAYGPTNTGERFLFILLILMGGFIWTQVISRSTALFTSLDRHRIAYQQTMDDINSTTTNMHLSESIRRRLRKFFMNTQDTSEKQAWEMLTLRMSPQLRRDTLREVNKHWMIRIPVFSRACVSFVTDVTQAMRMEMYSDQEHFGHTYHMYLLVHGVALSFTGRVIPQGVAWGQDHLLLYNRKNLSDNQAMAMNFARVQVLSKSSFLAILASYPEHQPMVRRETLKAALVRGIRSVAEEECRQRSRSRDFSTHSSPGTPNNAGTSDDGDSAKRKSKNGLKGKSLDQDGHDSHHIEDSLQRLRKRNSVDSFTLDTSPAAQSIASKPGGDADPSVVELMAAVSLLTEEVRGLAQQQEKRYNELLAG
eukprot:CAMPEP_0180740992 /NCGR_PEP_ID=MMETSP1038_2-20121128/26170_1 /TAXON_ID=632150 /ORGANISM="Azadinium spinosum, Strain 3D9" /LENGTH=433 /DNA_ID=CAMNT_0022774299 /DNA_START=330 /DNA_END=1628 /DNA_ORIENTATION=+